MTKRKTRKRLSPQEKALRKEKSDQRNEISTILKNIGFQRLQYIDGKHFEYDERKTEIDDIFIFENIIILIEYTTGKSKDHLFSKKIFYDKVNQDKRSFINFMLEEEKLKSFRRYHDENILGNYTINELRLKIVYCSKKSISEEHKRLIQDVIFFDYHIVQYFKSLTNCIKKSSKYEFLEFLEIPFEDFSINIKKTFSETHTFKGNILPEEKSKFDEGYKIVSFYIDAESLLRRSYVLRQNGWRDIENVEHYQRMLEKAKISRMRKYLSERGRVFINNIIATISTDKIKLYDNENNRLELKSDGQFSIGGSTDISPTKIEIEDSCNIIGLIDGQHRTYAYHEGDDQYESIISELRTVQNLLVTGILYPKVEHQENRLKFEANLFLEINTNQKNVPSQITQKLELMINPFSPIAIGKRVMLGLNKSGPIENMIEQYWYEKGKIKTASIVSFGLKPLVKIEDIKARDSIFIIWDNLNKQKLKQKDNDEFELLEKYIEFCIEKIRDILIALKANLDANQWQTYSYGSPEGILSVVFVNGVLNVLRLLIENNKISNVDDYKVKLRGINEFDFRQFKSSYYRKLGTAIYEKYF